MKDLFVGADTLCPVADGSLKSYVFLDNGASTPSLKCVQNLLNQYIPYYSSVHRGTGFKSLLSTHLYELARETVLKFVNANPEEHVCIFGRNTTEAINKLAKRFPFTAERNIVLTTGMEHHADDLPWRAFAPKTVHVNVLSNGALDLEDLKTKINEHKDKIALVAITGASNVTGILNPISKVAVMAHEVGAQIFVDCAQLIAHRKIDMKPLSDPEHIDYIAFSGHKMYAPFGTGALVGLKETFNQGEPEIHGGGAVQLVTLDTVIWAPTPDRDEAGSPNVPGAVALIASIRQFEKIGMDYVAKHEANLTAYALKKMATVPGIKIFGNPDPDKAHEKVGVIPFIIENKCHSEVAAILGYEYGIGVRSGCFCAHPLIATIMGISEYIKTEYMDRITKGEHMDKPGMIRASFGLYNDEKDVDALYDALIEITSGKQKFQYVKNAHGEYAPQGYKHDFDAYVDIEKSFDLPSNEKTLEKVSSDSTKKASSTEENDSNNHELGSKKVFSPILNRMFKKFLKI